MADPDAAAIERRIRESFTRQSMMATFGAEILSVAPGAVVIAAPVLPGSRQQQGAGHAALGDRLIATGRVVRAGRRLTIVTAEVEAETDGKRKLVALLQGTMVPVG